MTALSATAVLACVVAGHASAHAFLLRTVPAGGASLSPAPRTIRLEFDENVSSSLSRVSVVGARTGPVAGLHIVKSRGRALSVELRRLPRDLYRIAWRTVSEDDLHATAGTLVFGVDTAVPASAANAAQASSPAVAPEEVLLRWEDFTAVSALIGALATLLFVLPAAERRAGRPLDRVVSPLTWVGSCGCVAALVSGAGLLVLQVGRAGGSSQLGSVLTRTTYGHAWIAREAILALLGCALLGLRRFPASRTVRVAATTLATGLVVPLALVGHAASVKGAVSVATAVLAVHILTASLWVGGVLALCVATTGLVRAGERSAGRALALSFGRLAVVGVALLALSGIAILGIHVRSLDALVTTGYGTTLIVKTGLFLLAGGIGLATMLGLRWGRAPGALRTAWAWSPRLEAALLVSVLVPAAMLTASAPARQSLSSSRPQPGPPVAAAETFADADDLIVSLAVEPNRPGQNFITAGVHNTRRPAPARIRRVTVSLSEKGKPPRSITLAPLGPGQWQTVTTLPPGGQRMEVRIERPRLPDASTATTWTVSAGAPRPAVRAERPSAGGIMEQPLQPVLERVSLALTALLLLTLLGRYWHGRLSVARLRASRSRALANLNREG